MGLKRWHPSQWASLMPNGLGMVKPNHYKEILCTVWNNRSQLPFAWRILKDGVCDGCALGTTGMRDFTMTGVHLCTVRLNLLELNTMGPLDVEVLGDVRPLLDLSAADLRGLGRLPYPMLRRKGELGFTRVSWDRALDVAAGHIRDTDPRRFSLYLTSRGITNEVYYVAQKVARFLGTNNVDNSSRVCPRAQHHGHDEHPGGGSLHMLVHRLAWHRPADICGQRRSQQPARDHQVHLLRQAAGDQGPGNQYPQGAWP